MHPDPPRTTALRQWAQDQQAMPARVQGALLQADGHAQSSEEIAHRAEVGSKQVTWLLHHWQAQGLVTRSGGALVGQWALTPAGLARFTPPDQFSCPAKR